MRTESIRERFGLAMLELGRRYPRVVVVTGDLMYPTQVHHFAQAYPDRFYDVGIAEQNMIGVAAGMATCGKIPFVCSYANFTALRACEQIRNDICYTNLNVKIAGLSSGLTYGVGGPTHQSYEDLATMRSMANMTVVVPADANAAEAAVFAAYEHDGPVFLRLGRGPEPVVYDRDASFTIGRACQLREGQDVSIIANGPMVYEALSAAEHLEKAGIDCRVYDMHTLKPLDLDSLRSAGLETNLIVTVEEHYIIGGLGSAVLEGLNELGVSTPVMRIGIPDLFPIIGPTNELRAHYGLCADNIVRNVKAALSSI
ncbi:MAG: transketolase family protein [Firmicutes bacterium]|nr:transketolase family protein [Candidatus Fermentithermobacillaceae bacterium]